MRRIVFILLLLLSVNACTTKSVQDGRYDKRLCEAKWLFYELNFLSDSFTCDKVATYDTSICFVDGLIIDTVSIGDTLEITIFSTLTGKETCITLYNNFTNTFGFYPNTDTVVYTSTIGLKPNRLPETNFEDTTWKSMGVLSRLEYRSLFKKFIVENESELNSFLKKEAKRRGYIK